MFSTRIRKILADVMSRRGRTILVSLSIIIGVFGVTTLVSMGDLLLRQMNADLDEDVIAMTHLYMIPNRDQPLSLAENAPFLDALRGLPGVTDVEGQAIYPTDWQSAGAVADSGTARFEQGTVIAFTEPFDNVGLEPIARVMDGRYPVDGQNEVAVEQRFADEYGIGLGDTIIFRPHPTVEWKIVGIVFHPYLTISPYMTDVTTPSTPPESNIYTTYGNAQRMLDITGLTSFYARYADVDTAQAGLSTFTETIATQTPYIPTFSYVEDPAANRVIERVEQVTPILNILAVVAMIVSAFLVVNVINTIVMEQKRQIGVLKSLGATRWDIVIIYCGMALIYGLIGTIFGVLLAVPVAALMAQAIAPMVGTYIEALRISQVGVFTGIALGLLVPVLAALPPVLNGTRVSILDAMTDLGIASNWGQSRLAHLLGRLPLPVTVRQALSNIAQKRGRLTLTGLTLMLAVGAFMGVTAVFGSLDESIQDIFATNDYEILMTTQGMENFEQIDALLTGHFADITGVHKGYSVAISLAGYTAPESEFAAGSSQIDAVGIDPGAGVIHFDLAEGRGWEDDPTRHGLIVNQTVSENIGKSAGDTVLVTVGGVTQEFEVLGVDRYPFDSVFFDWQALATLAGYTNDAGQPVPSNIYISLAGEPDAAATADRIDAIKSVLLANDIPAVYANQPQNEDGILEMMGSLGLIFNMASVVMGAVGAIGLLATLSMAVFERQKEIGIMRSLGAGSSTIIAQFLVEGVLVGVIAWVASLPLSYLLGLGINASLDFGDIAFSYPPPVAGLGLAGVIAVASLASAWPALTAARKTVSDILRYQ